VDRHAGRAVAMINPKDATRFLRERGVGDQQAHDQRQPRRQCSQTQCHSRSLLPDAAPGRPISLFYRFAPTGKGLASHAGVRHEDGRSAIHELARQILCIEGKTDDARGITCNVGLVEGGTGVNVVSAECPSWTTMSPQTPSALLPSSRLRV
jgi:Peptidase dimerisation domain